MLLLLVVAVVEAYYYCSSNLNVPLPINATNKQLLFVAVVHRHGDRTPVYATPVDDGVTWNCTLDTLATTNRRTDAPALPIGRVYRRDFVPDEEVLDGDCEFGQLTGVGDAQHHRLGSAYRAKYVTLLRHLPSTFNASLIWLRSTEYSRTYASLAANIGGLYPPKTRTDGLLDIWTVKTRDKDRDYLMGGDGTGCPKVKSLLDALNKTGAFDQVEANLAALGAYLKTAVGTNNLMPLRDNALARLCRNLPQYKARVYTQCLLVVLFETRT
jgi:hypothetical protein